jgi:hypothetical protein
METRSVDSSKPDSGTAPVRRRESSSMRNVNNVIRRDAGSFSDDLIPFFCECQSLGCYSGIWLSPAAFDLEVAAQTGWLLLEGHEPSALWHRREPLPTRETVRSRRALHRLPANTNPGEDVAA